MAPDRTLPTRLRAQDRVALGFAAVVILLAAASSNEPAAESTSRDLDGLAVVLLVLAVAAVVAARAFPATGAVVVLVLGFVWYGTGYTSGLINVATLLAFYTLGASESQRRKATLTAISVVVVLANIALLGDGTWSEALTAAGYIIVAVLFGELVRHRHLLVDQYARRAEQAEAEARQRVAEERLQIARDVHDVLAHTVSAMTVQAGVAADRLENDPRGAADALMSVREAGRQAIGELKATVAVLRSGSRETSKPGEPRPPAPGLDQIEEVAAAARDHGLDVVVDIQLSEGRISELGALTAYRVVQEGVTNAVRHAADASWVRISIREERSSLTVEVRDDGLPTGNGVMAPGFGLRGMAERVESVGGKLWHGRGEEGGWVVRASLPLGRRAP